MVEEVSTDTYTVDVRRGEKWWVLSVQEIVGAHSQARSLREVGDTASDLIALMLNVDPDSFNLRVQIHLPPSVSAHLRARRRLLEAEAESRTQAAEELRAAARELVDAGLSLRDVGEALQISHQRAHQLTQ